MTLTPEQIDIIIADEYFKLFVAEHFNILKQTRNNRPEPKPGYSYRRDWFDRMDSNGQLNVRFFIENAKSVWLHQSSLSSEIRNIVQYVTMLALGELFEFIRQNNTNDAKND